MRRLLIFALFLSVAAFAQEPDGKLKALIEETQALADANESASFAGAPNVVLREPIVVIDDLVELGLNKDRLRTQIELILRRNGIPLVSSLSNAGWLVTTTIASSPSHFSAPNAPPGQYMYAITVSYHEYVLPIRRLEEPITSDVLRRVIGVTLWEKHENGYAEQGAVVKKIQTTYEEILNQFALAYLRANPRN